MTSGSNAVGDPALKHLQHPTQPPPDVPPVCAGDDVTFGRGRGRGTGYLARSVRAGPGVLVLHDWFGLAAATRAFCDALCHEGFTALAPDLYDGRRASTIEQARSLKNSSDPGLIDRRVRTAAEHLRDNWHPRLGIVGFSMGAAIAMEVAADLGEAVVLYYGTGGVDPDSWRVPLLGHYAESDEFEPPEHVSQLFERLEEATDDVELVFHPGTGHWFASADVPDAYDPAAAARAWTETVDFLQHHLA